MSQSDRRIAVLTLYRCVNINTVIAAAMRTDKCTKLFLYRFKNQHLVNRIDICIWEISRIDHTLQVIGNTFVGKFHVRGNFTN